MIDPAKLREFASGRDKWFAMGREEKSYFIDFDSESEACEWMDDQQKRMKEWVGREGIHIVKQRVFSEADEMMSAAADRIDALQASLDRLHGAKFSDRDHTALVDRAERNEANAARYRWLREQHWNESDIAVVRYPKESVKLGSDCPSGQRLDDLFDAALSATKE